MIVFYKIFCKDPSITDCYIGQTLQPLQCRFNCHKYASKNSTRKFYKFVNENGGWSNFDIVQISETEDFEGSVQKEFELMKIHNATLNTITELNQKQIKPKEELKQNQKEYRKQKVTCSRCGKELQRHSLKKHQFICL